MSRNAPKRLPVRSLSRPTAFRTVGFPSTASRPVYQARPSRRRKIIVPFGFPSPFGPIANCVDSPFCAGERIALGHHRSSSVCCSTPGALAPVRVILSRSIVTYWPHPPHLQAQLDFAAWRLIRAAFAVRLRLGDPQVVPCFRCTFLLDMPPITTTRSPSAASAQFFTDDVSLRRKQSGSALLGFPSSASDGVCLTGLPWL